MALPLGPLYIRGGAVGFPGLWGAVAGRRDADGERGRAAGQPGAVFTTSPSRPSSPSFATPSKRL